MFKFIYKKRFLVILLFILFCKFSNSKLVFSKLVKLFIFSFSILFVYLFFIFSSMLVLKTNYFIFAFSTKKSIVFSVFRLSPTYFTNSGLSLTSSSFLP